MSDRFNSLAAALRDAALDSLQKTVTLHAEDGTPVVKLSGVGDQDVMYRDGLLTMTLPGGYISDIPAGEVQQWLGRGGHPTSPSEYDVYRASEHPGEAFGRAVASGASLGLVDLFEGAADPTGAYHTRLLREANPGATIAGEIGGGLLGAPGLVAGVAGRAAKVLGRAGVAAAEGAAYSLQPTTTHLALSDDHLTAESIASAYVTGVLLGAGTGLAAEGLTAVTRRIANRLRSMSTKIAAEDASKAAIAEQPALAGSPSERIVVQRTPKFSEALEIGRAHV